MTTEEALRIFYKLVENWGIEYCCAHWTNGPHIEECIANHAAYEALERAVRGGKGAISSN